MASLVLKAFLLRPRSSSPLRTRFRAFSLFVLFSMLFVSAAADAAERRLYINGMAVDAGMKAVARSGRPEAPAGHGKRWIVRFNDPVREADKERVIKLGCRLLDYLPDFAFSAVMDEVAANEVAKLPFIEGVAPFRPDYRLTPKLRRKAAVRQGERVGLHLRIEDGARHSDVRAAINRLKGRVTAEGGGSMRVEIAASALADLAAIEGVAWINERREMHVFNDTTRWVIQSGIPGRLPLWDRGIVGTGQVVGIGDTGLDYDMPWFFDASGAPIGPGHRKIIGYDSTYGDDYDADTPGHGTHIAGTVAGDRTPVDGSDIADGMAPKALLFIQDLTAGPGLGVNPPDDLGLMFATAYNAGVRIHTDSWGNFDDSYGPGSESVDRFVWEHRDFLALFANGNGGPGTGTVCTPATAKNIISVGAGYNGEDDGAVAPFSSWGPTADGRIKPTVVAPGAGIVSADSDGVKDSFNSGTTSLSGTSMATPAVAGAAALVRQYFMDGFFPSGSPSSSDAFIPSAALIKGVIVNSAQNMTGDGTGGPIPSIVQGWGRINLSTALTFAGDGSPLQVADRGEGIGTGESWSRQFPVEGGRSFKATLVWSDYPGAPGAEKALVNDLDLTVTTPDGTVLTGNAFANGESLAGGNPDRLNVEEQVLVRVPPPGFYTVTVSGYNVPFGPQPFALVVTGASRATSTGEIGLDRLRYKAGDQLTITVSDRDLNLNPALPEQVKVRVASDTEPTGKTIVLTENGPGSSVFIGSLPLAPASASPEPGKLRTADGDTVTATYLDADDGSGRAATLTATAVVDDTPPAISGLGVTGLTETSATIAWETDEPADSSLGGDMQAGKTIDTRMTVNHSISLSGLREGATYHAVIGSADEAGNLSEKSLSFTTQSLPPSLTVTSSEMSPTYRPATVVSGVSADPSGVSSITVNGVAADYRAGDGSYSRTVPLQFGDNTIAVRATDFSGNSTVSTVTVTRLRPPDLVMQKVAGPSVARQPVTVTDTVCNAGPGDSGAFLVGFFLSGSQSLTGDDTLIGSRSVPSLAPGACSSGSTQLDIPAGMPGGTPYIIAQADCTNLLPDADRSNNVHAGNRIAVPYPSLPAPSSITVPPENSTGAVSVSWGESIGGSTYILEYSKNGGRFTKAYKGGDTHAAVTVKADGTYVFRVRATRTNYLDSASVTGSCTVRLVCGTPSYISVPQGNSTGKIAVNWGASDVSGVTYVLEYAREGGSFVRAYSGQKTSAAVTAGAGGNYTIRVRATKSKYAASSPAAGSCAVTLVCAAPSFVTAPSATATTRLTVNWGSSDVSGVTYVLECSREGGPYTAAYKGTKTRASVPVMNGPYSFRVKATKKGYAESGWTATGQVAVITRQRPLPGRSGRNPG